MGEPLDLLSISKVLPELRFLLYRGSETYDLIEKMSKKLVSETFGPEGKQICELLPSVEVQMPYHKMGAINSTHLFGVDELILFSFYSRQIDRLTKVADIGANIGLHSIVLSKLGFQVRAFEPDPLHRKVLEQNLILNNAENVEVHGKAVSIVEGFVDFVRVLGNTTGSHILGAKDSYGEKESFKVQTARFIEIMDWAELIKLDVEGHEAEILCGTSTTNWIGVDAIIEVGSIQNAERIYNHFRDLKISIFSQKNSWREVQTLSEMPVSHREGSIYVSQKKEMPWQ